MRLLTVDIETTPHTTYTFGLFNQNIGINQIVVPTRMLCFAAKWHGKREVLFYRSDGSAKQQREMAIHAFGLMEEADAVITWNGDAFDIPHLNREFFEQELGEPAPFVSIDLIKPVRKRFKFASNKLDWVSQVSGVGAKLQHHGMPLWIGCMNGDSKSWRIMERYNKQDVRITEKDYDRFKPWITNHPNVLLMPPTEHGTRTPSMSGSTMNACPTCGSTKIQARGTAVTAVSVFQRYQCQKCGHWFRATKRMYGSEYR